MIEQVAYLVLPPQPAVSLQYLGYLNRYLLLFQTKPVYTLAMMHNSNLHNSESIILKPQIQMPKAKEKITHCRGNFSKGGGRPRQVHIRVQVNFSTRMVSKIISKWLMTMKLLLRRQIMKVSQMSIQKVSWTAF